MFTIFFVDDGQDFLEWDVNEKGDVIDCRPFQADVWVGTVVHNKDIKPGDILHITTPDGISRTLSHAVEKVQELV